MSYRFFRSAVQQAVGRSRALIIGRIIIMRAPARTQVVM
jgi:hypothetical protein